MAKTEMQAQAGTQPRRWLACLFVLLLSVVIIPPTIASAQSEDLTAVEQSVSYTYGESLTFSLSASAPTEITAATLTILVDGFNDAYIEDIAIEPTTDIHLAREVTVEALNLPPAAKLLYNWELTDLAGQAHRTTVVQAVYADNSVPWEWAEVTDDGVTIHTAPEQAEAGVVAHQIAVSAMASARRQLGVAAPQDVHIYVYPELTQMAQALRLHGAFVQDWVAAYAIPTHQIALIAAPAGTDMLYNLERDIPHEVTHLVVGYAAGDHADEVPGWLSEGLALMSAPTPNTTLQDRLAEAVSDRGLLAMETLCAPSFTSLPPDQATLAYAQSESFVRYISNRYGPSAVRGLLQASAAGLSCQDTVQRVFSIPLAELERQWHNDLLSQAARTADGEIAVAPWLAVWLVSVVLAALFVAPQPARRSRRSNAEHDASSNRPPQTT